MRPGVLLLLLITHNICPVYTELDHDALFQAFTEVFPLKDGSAYLTSYNTSVLEKQALTLLSFIGVPQNVTEFCQQPEEQIIRVMILASLGNLIANTTDGDECASPFVSDATSGVIERANSFASNRVLIFEVIIFSLLLALARAWYVIQSDEEQIERLEALIVSFQKHH